MDYTPMEMMVVAAARELQNGATVAVGTGAPCAAAMLAQKTHAPELVVLFEAGGFNPQLPEMPVSVGDSRTFYKSCMAGSMGDIMEACSRGMVDYSFLGGAQIDMYGNLNSTLIGSSHQNPQIRLPGSGGANDFASFCWRTMMMTVQDKRRFVEKVDFMTTPGWLQGGNTREEAGLPSGTGPYRVITDMAIMDFEPESRRMRVCSVHPGYSFEDVQNNCGFALMRFEKLQQTASPGTDDLKILREEVDPLGYVIGR